MERSGWITDTIDRRLTDVKKRSQGLHPEIEQLCANYGAIPCSREYSLGQQSPTFLAPGTGFVEDRFSTDWGSRVGGMVSG